MRLKKVFIIVIAALFLLATPVAADTPTVSDVSKGLVCQCGCNMVLLNCSHVECGSRNAMTALIQEKIDQGQSEEEIVQFFVTQYGEQVLAAPTKKGFNMTAWLLPPIAILFGGGTIYAVLRKWVKRGRIPQTIPMADEGDDEYQRQVEKELKEYTDRGFR